jgi:hypothetical protein
LALGEVGGEMESLHVRNFRAFLRSIMAQVRQAK